MTQTTVRVHKNTYADSVKLLAASRALLESDGVDWGIAVTGTSANLEILVQEGFDDDFSGVGANDLVLAARGVDTNAGLDDAHSALFSAQSEDAAAEPPTHRSITEVASIDPSANLAVISVGGPYAGLEAHKALTAGMDVLLFSDNVPLETEVELKQRALDSSRYVMGPGAGTAMVDGLGLGFANAVSSGSVGVIAAAGTGAQEVMTLVHRAGLGVTDVIGVGGRDMTDDVGGLMAGAALTAMENDPRVELILLVSKPPSPTVASGLLQRPTGTPIVAALVGLDGRIQVADHVTIVTDLESGVRAACDRLGARLSLETDVLAKDVVSAIDGLEENRTAIRGLFSGGTLCYEAMTLIKAQGETVYSNTPLRQGWTLEQAPADGHLCLDLGEEEFTKNRPHPMIDPTARVELIEAQAADPAAGVVLLDIVLGYGSHDDPAGLLAPACEKLVAGGLPVVVYVLGTDADPQGLESQRHRLEEAGCIIAPTNARAARAALAIATRDPALCGGA